MKSVNVKFLASISHHAAGLCLFQSRFRPTDDALAITLCFCYLAYRLIQKRVRSRKVDLLVSIVAHTAQIKL
jgi:hypothetical protein